MIQRSRLVLSIFLVPGLLKRILQAWGKLAQALKEWIFRRLSPYRTISSLRDNSSTNCKRSDLPKAPPEIPTDDRGRSVATTRKSVDGTSEKETTDDEDYQYYPVVDGERISLDNISPSLSIYPLSGGGIRNRSASTRSLASSLSAHSQAVEAGIERTPGPSVIGNSSRGASMSTVNISVIPESPSHSPVTQTPISVAYETLSLNDVRFRPRSPREEQPRNGLSDNGFENNHSPISSIKLETRSSSPSIEDRESLHVVDSGVDISNGQMPQEPASYLQPEPLQFPTPEIRPLIPKLSDIDIAPIMPESILRYSQRPQIPLDAEQPPIKPLTIKFGELKCRGWEICVHPEGARYFYNREKRIYVEGDVDKFDRHVKDIVHRIEDFVYRHRIWEAMDKNTDLVIWLRTPTISNPDAGASTCYYFVHHTTRTIFFLDDYEPKSLSAYNEIRTGATSQSHLGNEIESQYWFHCQLFPHSLRLTSGMVKEMRGIVLHFIGDTTTCPKGSTAPFDLDDLYKILNLISEIEKSTDTQYPSDIQPSSDHHAHGMSPDTVGANSCFSRHMFMFSRARFLHFHGEPHARLDRTTSVYGDDPHRRTLLIKSLSWTLFFAPDFHLRNLQNMWVDGITQRSIFQRAVLKMNDQWAQMTLMATVFLAVDVSFWSIQSDDISSGPNRSPAQIFSYLSACACISSIVLGMLLLLQNQTKMRETADDFEAYMSSWHHDYLGLETLAILHSLPFAILMWGIIFFSLAVSSLCFMKSSIPTRLFIGMAVFAALILVLWCVWAHWNQDVQEEKVEWLKKPTSSLQPSDYQIHSNHPVYPGGLLFGRGSHEMNNLTNPGVLDSNIHWPPPWDYYWHPANIGRRSIQSLRSYFLPEQHSDPLPA